jgi:hypothetical protein
MQEEIALRQCLKAEQFEKPQIEPRAKTWYDTTERSSTRKEPFPHEEATRQTTVRMVNNDHCPNAAIRHPTPPNQSTYKDKCWDRHRQRAHTHASCTTYNGEEASQEAGELRSSS